jgi:uncharacterized repeat protein (TIGR03803 family)
MKQKSTSLTWCTLIVAVLAALGTVTNAWAAKERVPYNFGTVFPDGTNPEGGLVFDASGNLYGTTFEGGTDGNGIAYKLTPSGGGWTETILYNFCTERSTCSDGSAPIGSLTIDIAGNLYGTTYAGGSSNSGVVFELSSSADGWTETVLYNFSGGSDGGYPIAGVVFDRAGNLYGTTLYGGTGSCTLGCGVVFELTKNSHGSWAETVLHSFEGGSDGDTPAARVTLGSTGRVYGTTAGSGPTDPGTVFMLVNSGTGWKETVLYNFKGKTDGNSPEADVVLGRSGSVFGTTRYGGSGTCSAYGYNGCGTVFVLTQSKTGWTERVLHSFKGGTSDGADPAAGVVFSSTGAIYGTTAEGGATGNCGDNGCGTVFSLSLTSGGKLTETLLHEFNDAEGDGAYPLGDLILDSAGNIYSTTQYGGAHNQGIVFELTR